MLLDFKPLPGARDKEGTMPAAFTCSTGQLSHQALLLIIETGSTRGILVPLETAMPLLV